MYLEIREISSGASGKVLEVAKEVKYALKVMHMREIDGKKLRHFMMEYEILNHLHHPNIIRAFGISLDSDSCSPSILLEFCPQDLHSLIKERSVSNIQLAFIIHQIIEGMKYVHSCRIIHRDIKPSNILITEDGIIKICDFGISKQSQTSIFGGTQKFMAPELIDEHDNYDEKVDVYSFGVLLFQQRRNAEN
ncbi:Serine/threonine-protein kinase 36 [Tritrichomonas musculus]|uniref:mitogen-activated protein kinase kinase n=1 Tax=Tritrichomonas musculus TaxID=1915356 RepID=A0ABR2JTL3_9EUKA